MTNTLPGIFSSSRVPRVLVVGHSGQLARALAATHKDFPQISALYAGRSTRISAGACDFSDPAVIENFLSRAEESEDFRFTTVVNTAAYTAVDACEEEAHREEAWRLNADLPALLAEYCSALGATLIHVSTDYVFGSPPEQRRLWLPTDTPHPHTVYGLTKYEGEQRIVQHCLRTSSARAYIVRTAWLFSGDTLPENPDFVSTMAARARAGEGARVVNDQYGCPTYACDLARGLWQLACADVAYGFLPRRNAARDTSSGGCTVVHGVGGVDDCAPTWWDLAREVYALCGASPDRVLPVTTKDFPRRARRPSWSVLSSAAWNAWSCYGVEPLPSWKDGLRRALGYNGDV